MSEVEKNDIDEPLAEQNGTNDVNENAEIVNNDEKPAIAKKNKKKKSKKPSSK